MRWKRHQCGGEQSFGQPVVAICINAGEKKFLPSTLIDTLGFTPARFSVKKRLGYARLTSPAIGQPQTTPSMRRAIDGQP